MGWRERSFSSAQQYSGVFSGSLGSFFCHNIHQQTAQGSLTDSYAADIHANVWASEALTISPSRADNSWSTSLIPQIQCFPWIKAPSTLGDRNVHLPAENVTLAGTDNISKWNPTKMENTIKEAEIMKPINVELLEIKMDQVALQRVGRSRGWANYVTKDHKDLMHWKAVSCYILKVTAA